MDLEVSVAFHSGTEFNFIDMEQIFAPSHKA